MSIGAGTDEAVTGTILPEDHNVVDIVWNAESANEHMVNVLIEANVFVVGGQAVDIVMGDEDEAVYEGAPASHMVNLFIVLFVDDFHVLFSVSEKSDVRASFQFENLVCLELHFVEAGCR